MSNIYNFLKLFIPFFLYNTCQGQKIELKYFLPTIGMKEIRIGMTLNEFNKIENNYYLVNNDSLLLEKDLLPPLINLPTNAESNNKFSYSEKFLSYKIQKLHYVFNNKKRLHKINWFFSNLTDINILTDIKELLGDPDSIHQNTNKQIEKTIWQKDSLSLICSYEKEEKKLLISLTNPFIPEELNIFNVNEIYEKQIKAYRKGKGNNSFTLSLASLENVVSKNITAKAFENILPSWQTNTYYNWVGLTTNKKTKLNDVPVFHLAYDFELKNNYVTAKIEIEKTLTNIIKSIEIIYFIDGESLAKFKKDLKIQGYYLDEMLTKTSFNFNEEKIIFINQKKRIMVLITQKKSGYSFEVRKL